MCEKELPKDFGASHSATVSVRYQAELIRFLPARLE